jgi:ribosomal protein S12 methylthiotransferase accessory factor
VLLTAASAALEPEHAWVLDLARKIGISRLADVTGLDYVGMPVWQAIRPQSRSYVVTQGKGLTPQRAMISAIAESTELYCAERVRPAARASIRAMEPSLGYDVATLPSVRPAKSHAAVQLDWVRARELGSNRPTWLPRELFDTDYSVGERPHASPFRRTTNGLGAGSTNEHACLHGLLEVVERHALSTAVPEPLSTESLGDELDALVSTVARAGLELRLASLATPLHIPVLEALVHEPDTGVVFVGSAARCSSREAALGAITEALQSRLTFITGTRDDLDDSHYAAFRAVRQQRAAAPPLASCASLPSLPEADARTHLATVVGLVAAHTGTAPIACDLSIEGLPLSVAFVAAPGLRFDARLH